MATIAHWRVRVAHRAKSAREPRGERPFWEVVLMLYGGIFLLAVLMTAVCFTAAWLVVGRPY